MSTIERAVELLDLFTPAQPELGLSDVTRLMHRDKATCYRHLTALTAVGLVEQIPDSRKYRIGPAVLRWAARRELAVPRLDALNDELRRLADATGELAHAAQIDGHHLRPLADVDAAAHRTRVVIDDEQFPLHATASGHAVLAFAEPELLAYAKDHLDAFTPNSITKAGDLQTAIDTVRATGFATVDQGFEEGVIGIAVPLFDGLHKVAGSVAVATVALRMTPGLKDTIKTELIRSGRTISAQWGGTIPPALDVLWDAHIGASTSKQAETFS